MQNVTYPRDKWRLLLESQPHQGAMDLAIDEALLRCAASGESSPTLRLYRWHSPSLVLGRGQRVTDADLESLRDDDIVLLRRMTGGTAVLNDNVISYSVAAADDEIRFAGSIAESYRGISMALAASLELLGVRNIEATPMNPDLVKSNRTKPSPVCFEIPSYYEITVNGKKLVGSSQMRIRGGILQHGSLYLDSDISKISCYLSSHPDPQRIRTKTTTLKEALGRNISYGEVIQTLLQGFSQAFNLELSSGSLLPWESSMVKQLVEEKYGNSTWTTRL